MSWGLTGLRSPSDELRSEGNIQHSCAYSEGRGPGAGVGAGRAAPPRFQVQRLLRPLKTPTGSLFASIKMFARIQKEELPRWLWNGIVKREIELDGDKRFVTGREAANPGANLPGNIAAAHWQIKGFCPF